MSKFSKKRSASMVEDSDASDPEVAPQPAKKVKDTAAAASADGKDDEGNPFWEVSELLTV